MNLKTLSKGSERLKSEYIFEDEAEDKSHNYLRPTIEASLNKLLDVRESLSVLDLGCGNGSMIKRLGTAFPNCSFTGADPSSSAQDHHGKSHPSNVSFIEWEEFSAETDLKFDLVISIEVIEHVYLPREYMKLMKKCVKESGQVIISTPYHGYFKNITLAVSGKLDNHFTALWDYGHIKFWSVPTLTKLLSEFGLTPINKVFCGRFYPLSKSVIIIAESE